MKRGTKTTFALLMIFTLIFSGCAKTSSTTKDGTSSTASTKSNEPVELTYWTPINAKSMSVLSDYSQMLCYQEIEKKLNIKLKFIHPAAGQEKEVFNLLLASRDYPDLIEFGWNGQYAGGLVKAAEDGVIIRLNDAIDKYAPDFKKVITDYPDLAKMIKTDNGDILSFPPISVDGNDYTGGFLIRNDWLKELGLKEPVTIDDWTNVLRQFKAKKNATAPITFESKVFFDGSFGMVDGAFGTQFNYYIDNGVVKYGPMEKEYKDYLKLMNMWYKEGLLDMDFATNDKKGVDSKILKGTSGALYGLAQANMSTYLSSKKGKDFDMKAVQYPVLKAGDEPKFLRKTTMCRQDSNLAVTTANKNVETSVKVANFFYTKEGNNIMSYGEEGKTFTMVDGKPKFTEFITKNPDGLTKTDAMVKSCRGGSTFPGFTAQDDFVEQNITFKQEKDARELWAKYDANTKGVLMPTVSLLPDEASEFSKINSDVKTYCEEMLVKFIIGEQSLDNYDKFTDTLKKMDIGRAIEIKKSALDRYNKR